MRKMVEPVRGVRVYDPFDRQLGLPVVRAGKLTKDGPYRICVVCKVNCSKQAGLESIVVVESP
jgi:hypothetical protein